MSTEVDTEHTHRPWIESRSHSPCWRWPCVIALSYVTSTSTTVHVYPDSKVPEVTPGYFFLFHSWMAHPAM